MSNETTIPITSLGTLRKRQAAAKDRAEQRIAAPDVRAARAAILDRREAEMTAEKEAATYKSTRPGELYRETLNLVPDALLEELERILPNLGTRTMADIVADVLRTRRRTRHAADIGESTPDVPKPAKKPAKAA